MKTMKKLFSILLAFSLMLSMLQTFTFIAAAAEPTVTGFSSTDDSAIAEFMMGEELATAKNLLYGTMPQQVYTYSNTTGTTKYVQTAVNTGSNGTNAYTLTGSNSVTHIAPTYALTDGLVPSSDNDFNFDSTIWSSSNTEHYLGFEWDLGCVTELSDFYVCFSSRAKGDERIAKAYEIYASETLADLYATPVCTVSDNTDGANRVTFPAGTNARYFAFRITECDNGNPTAHVYPRCKEVALTGTRSAENWAVYSGMSVKYSHGDTSLSYWMNNLSAQDPSNLIFNKTASVTYTDSTGTKDVSNNYISRFSNGTFDDGYINNYFTDDTHLSDSTWGDVIWDLGETMKFSEFWITFRPEVDGNAFIAAKYEIYCGNDKSTLFDSDPVISIDCNTRNINKITFNERSARYFAIRLICPNIGTWGSNQARFSISEAALIGPAKRTAGVTAVDLSGNEIAVAIGGNETLVYEGETVKLSAPAVAAVGAKTYLFDSFLQNGAPISSTLNGDNYETTVTVNAKAPVTVTYALAAEVSYSEAYIDNNIMTEIDGSATAKNYKNGATYTISTDPTYENYDLIGWIIDDVYVEATANGSYSLTLEKDIEIKAIYANSGSGQVILFQAKSGEQLGTFLVPTGQSISSVVTDEMLASLELPLVFGYTHTGWSVDLDEPCNASFTVTPTYTQNSETYNITVDGEAAATAKFDQKITLNGTKDNFSAWKNGSSTIATDKSYTLYAPGAIDLTTEAYGEGTQITDSVNLLNAIPWSTVSSKFNLSVLASIEGVSEENFIECGVLFTQKSIYDKYETMDDFNLDSEVIYKPLKKYPTDGVYMITLSNISAIGKRAARAYIKYYKDGKVTVAYSRTAITAKKDAAAMPETKYADAITKYADHKSIKLYEDNAIPYYNATFAAQTINSSTESGNNPTIAPYLVENAKACVVIYPGGGYYQRSDNSEGIAVAKAYNNAGYSAFVVRYRCGNNSDYNNGYNDQAIITDGQRAVQFVRYHADEFGIDPDKIAVCGFSAGGHLAMSVSQNEMEENYVGDRVGEISNKPNATILGYAVTTLLTGTFGSMPPILGANHTAAEKTAINNKYSGHLHASADLAPTFLFYGEADGAVPPAYNSEAYYDALIAAGASAEKHAYTGLGHGFGLGTNTAAAEWHTKSVTFLKDVAGLQAAQ